MAEAITDNTPGLAEMANMASGDAMTATPTFDAPKEPAKTQEPPKADAPKPDAAKPADKGEKKPEVKPDAAKPAEKKPEAKDDSLGDNYRDTQEYKLANSKLRKTVDRFAKERDEWRTKASEFETSSKGASEKIAEFEKKIAALEAKPVETKADTKLIEKYEGEIKALKQTVREYDYQKSDEFRDKFSVPFDRAYKKAVGEVTQLVVTKNDQQVQATEQDFAHIRSLPLGARRAAARNLFGDDYDLVLAHVSRLEEIREAAKEAVESEKQNYEVRQQETTAKQQKEQEEYLGFLKQSEQDILENIEGFKLSDDPKEKELWQKGLAFVEHALNNTSKLPASERAAHAAAVKMKAALYDLSQERIRGFNSKIQSLTEELAKFRESDPGTGGEKGEVEKSGDEEVGGISDMIAKAPAGWGR